jgi:hypothetical protein
LCITPAIHLPFNTGTPSLLRGPFIILSGYKHFGTLDAIFGRYPIGYLTNPFYRISFCHFFKNSQPTPQEILRL